MLKSTLVLILVLVLAGNASADLVGHWPLDNVDLINPGGVPDLSDNNNTGTVSGSNVTSVADRFGNPDSAILFGGAGDDNITIDGSEDLSEFYSLIGSMTITSWVYLDTQDTADTGILPTTRNGRILSKFGGGGSRGWSTSVEKKRDDVPLTAAMDISSDYNTPILLYDDASIATDAWVHYAAVYTAGTRMEIFLDGDSAISKTTGVPASQVSDNYKPVIIGGRASCGDCGWVGSLDDVRIYDEALTEAQIEDIMGPPATQPGDFDGDGDVDGADNLKWQLDLGDAANLALWKDNYGFSDASATALGAVPEPGSLALFGLAIGLVSLRRRQRS